MWTSCFVRGRMNALRRARRDSRASGAEERAPGRPSSGRLCALPRGWATDLRSKPSSIIIARMSWVYMPTCAHCPGWPYRSNVFCWCIPGMPAAPMYSIPAIPGIAVPYCPWRAMSTARKLAGQLGAEDGPSGRPELLRLLHLGG